MSLRLSARTGIAVAAFLLLHASLATAQTDFFTVTPCRVYDTRHLDPDPLPPDPLTGPGGAASRREIKVTDPLPAVQGGALSCGVPADAVAAVLNFIVIDPTKGGFLVAYDADLASPPIPFSTMNFGLGQTRANNATVELSSTGEIAVELSPSFMADDTTHLVVDVSGYFRAPDAPVVTTTAGTTAFTEDGGAVVVDAGVTVSDPDDTNLQSATVSLTSAPDGASEVLNATSCAGLTVTPGNPLTITGNQPLATYQTCLQSVTYNNTDQDPDTTDRTVNFVVNDGANNSNTGTKTVSVAAVNDAPVVTTTVGTTAFTEDGGPVVVDAGVTVSDVDDTNLESATVSLASAPDGAAEVLNATSCAGLTVTPGNPLTITGSQPEATYQTCLQSVTYNNTDMDPDLSDRTVNFVVNDGDTNSNTASKTVSVGSVPDAPMVTTTAGTTSFTEDGGAVVVDAGVTVSDPDDTNLQSATVSLTSAPDGASEVLNATSCAGLTVTPGNPLTITGNQPIATYQTCLQSVTYNNTDQDPDTTNRTVNFVVNDGTNNSNTGMKTVSVAAINDAPVVTTTGGSTSFTEDGGAVVVDAGVTVTDVDSANLASATVTITNPQDGVSEVLGASSCAGLTVTPGLNSLSITGSQPPASYQTCLQSVTYDNTAENPDTTPRVISFVANDGTASSAAANKTVTVAAVDDAPVVTTTGGTTSFTEDGGAVTVDSGVTVTDADSANLASATVTITNPQDGASEVLAATSCAGLTVTPGLNSLSITGSQPPSTYQTCLQSVTYNNTSQNPGTTPRVISFVANDGTSNSAAATKTVTVAAVADAPVVTTTGGTTAFIEDGGAVVVDSGVTVTDADSANLASATVSITNPQDGAAEVLGATSCAGLTVTPGLNVLSITGSQPPATYQTCLQSVTYNNTSQNPNTTPRVISFVANDGALNSSAATKTVTVAASPDAPVVTTTGGTTGFTEDGGAVVVDAGVTVTDADDTNLESATVSLASAPDGAAETLNATACAGLTVTPGNPLTISGSQSVATYQTCLQSVTYNNTDQDPTTTNRTVNFVVNDGDVNSNTGMKTVSVTALNDAPVVTTTGGITAFTEDGGAVVVDSGVTVTDVDDTNLESATVSLASAPDGASEVLSATSCAGLTVTPGNPLTITGSQPKATYQTCLQSVTYNNSSQNPNTTNRTVNFVVNDGDSNSNTASKTLSVTAVNDPPAITTNPVSYATAGHTQLHVEGKVLAGVASIADPTGVDTKAGPFTDVDGPVAPAIVDASGATANGGSYDIDSDGSFTYVPPLNFTGTDSFTYQVTDTVTPTMGTVNINVTNIVWYVRDIVDANNAAGGDGRSSNAFETIAAAETASNTNHYIYVFEGNTGTTPLVGGISLKDGQKLWGQGIDLDLPGFPDVVAATNQARLRTTAASTNVVSVPATAGSRNNVEIRGLDLEATGATSNAIDVTSSGANTIGITISDNTIRGATSEGIDVNHGSTGTATLAFHDNMLTATGLAADIERGVGAGGLTITAFHDNVVTGNSASGGLAVRGTGGVVTFDASSTAGIQPVPGGMTVIGDPGNRIGGPGGLILTNVTGALNFANAASGSISAGDLDIFTDTGAALDVAGGAGGFDFDVTPNMGVLVANAGPAAVISAADVNLQLNSLTSSTSSSGVSLTTVSGTFSAPSGSSITKSSGGGTAFSVDNSAAGTTVLTTTFAGTINASSGRSVSVNSADAGSLVSFSGEITDTAQGISLTNNTSATISFSGGLDLSTGANTGFNATGGGTVTVTDPVGATNNTITTTSGTALNVANTMIGASGLTFESISAGTAGADSSAVGIGLDTTGTAAGNGGLTVTGTGSANSGGTIQRKTGADGSTTAGIGIYLNSTKNPSFNWMLLRDFQNYAIRGIGVSGFTLANSTVEVSAYSSNGTSVAVDEASISFGSRAPASQTGLTGTASITNSTIRRGFEDSLSIFNWSGSLSLTIDNCIIRDTTGNDGVVVETHNTANIAVDARNSDFIANVGDHFQATADDSAVLDVKFGTNGANTLTGGAAGAVGQSIVINSGAFTGTVTFDVSSNSINGAIDTPINVNKGGGTGTFSGRIQNNTIGTSGVANSGTTGNKDAIRAVTNGAGSYTAVISGNDIKQVSGNGIFAIARDGTGGKLDLTITGNTLSEPNPGNNAVRVESGATSSDDLDVCADIGGTTAALKNTVNGDWGAGIGADEMRMRHQFSALCTFRMPGLSGGTTTDVVNHLTARNNGFPPATASATIAGGGSYGGGAACAQPSN